VNPQKPLFPVHSYIIVGNTKKLASVATIQQLVDFKVSLDTLRAALSASSGCKVGRVRRPVISPWKRGDLGDLRYPRAPAVQLHGRAGS